MAGDCEWSSLQHNITGSFCLVFVFTLSNVELLKMVIFYLLCEKQNFLEQQVNEENTVRKSFAVKFALETKAHCVRDKNKSKRTNSPWFKRTHFEQL